MHKPSPWILVLFLMQMAKLKNGTKTYHSKVPLRFIKITVDYTDHLIMKNRTSLGIYCLPAGSDGAVLGVSRPLVGLIK